MRLDRELEEPWIITRLRERVVCEAEHADLRVPHNGFGWIGTRCTRCGFSFFGEWEPDFDDDGQSAQVRE